MQFRSVFSILGSRLRDGSRILGSHSRGSGTRSAARSMKAPALLIAGAMASAAAPAAAAPSNAITSPMVGTVYLSPEPGAKVFVSPGDKVKKGDTLMLIEAMKTFNPVVADAAGTVKEILVSDSQPVEFGEPLIVVE